MPIGATIFVLGKASVKCVLIPRENARGDAREDVACKCCVDTWRVFLASRPSTGPTLRGLRPLRCDHVFGQNRT